MEKGLGKGSPCECSSRKADLSVTIQAVQSAIEPLVNQVVKFATERMSGDPQRLLEIDLALQEALANAVVHGCNGDSNLKVDCWVSFVEGKGLLIVINDPGPGFIPADVPDPMQEANMKFDHGRGVFLIKKLMDEVHFKNHGSEVHMIKY